MNAFWSSPIIFIQDILSITGLWPYLTTTQTTIRTIIMNVSLLAMYSVQVHSVLSMKYTMERTSLLYIDNFMSITYMCSTYYICLYRKEMESRCLKQIISHWKEIENTKEVDILLEYANICRMAVVTIAFTCIGFITFSFLIPAAPLLLDIFVPMNETRPRVLLYPIDWFPNSEKYFVELLLLQYVLCIVISFGCISGFSIYLTCLQHACAMFRVIECLLDNILREEEMGLSFIDNNAVYAKIIRIIGYHDTTTNFVDMLNENLNAFALLTAVVGTLIGGLRIVELLVEIERNADINCLIAPGILIIFHLIWIFMFCFLGQHLLDVSSTIFKKSYETPWYLMSKKMQQLLYFLMMRSGKASYISIGKMFVSSHELFSAFIQFIVSYSMILYTQHRRHTDAINLYETT